MEESRILGEDLPLTTDQLFERLGQIPGYTWDTTLQPVHSSYDHWQVTGTKHSSEPDVFSSTPASSSSFSKDSSFAHDSLRSEPRSFPRNNGRSSISEGSSGVASPRVDPEISVPVVARISSHIIRLEREYHSMKTIIDMSDPECKHTVRPIDIIRFTPQPGQRAPLLVTIFEFPGPNYLGELVSFGPAFYQAKGQCDPENLPLVDEVPLSVFLDFAIGACECLELLHYGLKNVHGEIRADAFHFSRETGAVKLSNTGNGSRAFDNALSEGWSTLSKESGAKDKLRSIAPEQTGRLLTEPDSRTDIYALGVLFWSMLVGRPAFDGNDPVEVVQNVLSKRLSPVSSKRMDTPDAISAVIQKMVQKQITDRYHTISSVKMDLQKIMKLLGDGDSQALKTFQIAQRDVTAFFTLPTALFGRKEECERILQVVQRRLQEPSVQPNTKTSVHPKYSFSSGSSVSGERIDPIEFGDASSDSGSYGLASFRNTPTPVPNLLPQLSSHASTNSVESSASTQKNLHLSRVKSPIDSRLSWDNSDKEAGAGGLSTPQENFPWLGKLMAQSKYRHGGRCEVITISGAGGSGKSDLIQRVQPEIRKGGYMAISRLDRSRRVPFEPFMKVLATLLQQIFSERDITTEYHSSIRTTLRPVWRTLHRTLDLPQQLIYPSAGNGKHLGSKSTVLPLQIKEAPEGEAGHDNPNLSGSFSLQTPKNIYQEQPAAKNLRFADIFVDVLRTMTMQKLICICLEDVQYADDETSGLLLEIMRTKLRCVFIVTGRPEEIVVPEVKTLFHSEGPQITRIELGPLSENDILKYVAATLHRPADNSLIPLAAIIQEKSRGIPFYIRLILETCSRKNCIWYSWRDSTWQFDIDRIFTELAAPDYGQGLEIDFVAKRFEELPSEARSILLWAAFLGSPFCFSVIQKLLSEEFSEDTDDEESARCENQKRTKLSQSSSNVVAGLQYLLQSYIILPGDSDDEFRFSFDRYAQAATLMKRCRNQEKMHFIIAQTLMKYFASSENMLYARAHHISIAAKLIKEKVSHRIKYREELSKAAMTAQKSSASTTALTFYQTCIFLLQDDPWNPTRPDVFYEETRELYLLTAEMFLAQGRASEATDLLSVVSANAHTPACKARGWVLQSRISSSNGEITAALDALLSNLSDLGVNINREVTWQEIDEAYAELSAYLYTADLDELFSRPLSEDRTLLAIGAVMTEALGLCVWTQPKLFCRYAIDLMNIYISRGAFPQIAYLCTHLNMIVTSRYKDSVLGLKLSDAALGLLDRCKEPSFSTRGVLIDNVFVNHMRVPMASTLPLLESSMQIAHVLGERHITLFTIGIMVATGFSLGQDLIELEQHCNCASEEVSDWATDVRGGSIIMAVRQAARALQGKTFVNIAEKIMSDHSHDEHQYLECLISSGSNLHSLNSYRAMMLIPLYLYGYYDRVVEVGTEIVNNIECLWSSRFATQTYFYLSLGIMSRRLEDPGRPGLKEDIELVKKYKKEIDFMESACHTNFGMWSLLVQALLSEISNDYSATMQGLEAALDHTQLHNFPLEEAMALELQVDFLVRRGARRAAQAILRHAIPAWNRMSATGKAKQLAERHEWLLRMGSIARSQDVECQTVDALAVSSNSVSESSGTQGQDEHNRNWLEQDQDWTEGTLDVSRVGLDIIDLSSILEFSQVMSSELEVDKLLTKMVGIILESCSGSEIALVITEFESQGWCVAAAGEIDKGEVAYADGLPFAEVEDKMAQQITHYTLRSREPVLVHNVLEDERFSNVSDVYASRNPEGRSVIALPILQANNFLGVIHIEGKPNSFTHRNLVVLRLVCNQVGISLANAFLFQEARKISAANEAMIEAQKRSLAQAREAEQKAKEAEAEARHNVKLKEEAAKAKSIFLANISHDLRTPMTGVIGLSELLKQTNLDRQQDVYVESIRVCADTLLTLINDILDFSKLEAGKMKVSTVPLNLRQTIAEVVRALRYTHRDRGLETIEDLDDIAPDLLVLGDPVRLHQIFMNLLSNSYKFTPKGSVTVRAKVAEEDETTIRVTCIVADTGIGISNEHLARLFRPFSQADSSTARSYGGSGLGLSICKAIIEEVLGGKIWLRSEVGVGTTVTFTVTFKKAPEDAVARTPWSQELSQDKKQPPQKRVVRDLTCIPRDQIRVCIAEDNPINQKIAVNFVHNLGLTSEVFSDGQQAVWALQQRSKEGNPFHVVLMDVQMPVLDGYDATRKIRENEDPNVNEVLVIAMTASAIEGDREKCIDAGMNNYLAKPVRSDVLRSMLDRYLAPQSRRTTRRKFGGSISRPNQLGTEKTSARATLPIRSVSNMTVEEAANNVESNASNGGAKADDTQGT
ncbi:Histidine Kinase A (phosphoacceptor) domain containing protein [Coccidioides posadasii C735 delta SOWgp]|uniref:histidine kinase n=1 Tax=Coccidioides posadasii (strain C735) TaxID=222929 RepID=C5PA63_COCP7|nr:Histidine Kinase A (phosphoacceptor) domain containing protein [Coccidioides posadasii C735 delta SOWgp]EER26625.1 Histidine Kinase A (phosphoacceptor) domain containing protein [Coccidioides posadasii C735 delta SOWgp]|eukprot:XP_003068770.1 Histidine Kinase A (phosphoacceptor) domain containing protein [Coccidioides posadasii C735 delta SOWgp]